MRILLFVASLYSVQKQAIYFLFNAKHLFVLYEINCDISYGYSSLVRSYICDGLSSMISKHIYKHLDIWMKFNFQSG